MKPKRFATRNAEHDTLVQIQEREEHRVSPQNSYNFLKPQAVLESF
jgi:hypothetical protein